MPKEYRRALDNSKGIIRSYVYGGKKNGRCDSWTILTAHGHVLVEIARNPQARIRDISAAAGITERTVQAVMADLEAARYIARTRIGRRIRYTVNPRNMFRRSAQDGHRIGPLLDLLSRTGTTPHPDIDDV